MVIRMALFDLSCVIPYYLLGWEINVGCGDRRCHGSSELTEYTRSCFQLFEFVCNGAVECEMSSLVIAVWFM